MKDFINVNKLAFRNTLKNIKVIPILAIVFLLLNITLSFGLALISSRNQGANFALGFIRYIVRVAFASANISLLDYAVRYNRFSFSNLKAGFTRYLNPLMNTFFYLTMIEFAINYIGQVVFIPGVFLVLSLILKAIESTIYEQTYLANNFGLNAIGESINFIKNNIVNWIIPMLIFIFTELYFDWFARNIFVPRLAVFAILSSIALATIYLYKGHLFKILNNSSKRKREFEGMFN